MDTLAPFYQDTATTLFQGDALSVLREMEAGSVHCVVTSPPYWALRAYHAGHQELGSEATIGEYLANQVIVFHEVKRVLREDGVCWVNIGDTYEGGGRGAVSAGQKQRTSAGSLLEERGPIINGQGNLAGVPERFVLALQADGWVWRSTVVWDKDSPMPESVNGWRWEKHRVKVSASARGSGYHAEAYSDTPMGARDGREFSDHASEYAPCPGCPVCLPNSGLVLRRGIREGIPWWFR